MKSKAARILGILISVLVLFASCGQMMNGGESRVSINLPYVNNGNNRAVSSDALQRIKGEHASYRVHINDRVLEGAGGNFSAYFPVGTKVDVFIECVNAKGEVILRTVTKSIVVTGGENVINFNLKADGNEVTQPTPAPQPVAGRVTYANGGDDVSGTPTDNTSYDENADVQLSATEPTRPGYKFNGWTATVELSCQNASGGPGTIPVGTPFVSASSSITSPTKITSFTMPASGVVLTAQWTLKNYTVTFNTDGGSSVNSITDFNINYGSAFSNSTKPGYSFQSWQMGGTDYTASTLKDAIKAGTVGSTSTTIALTARWDELSTLYVSDSGSDSNSGESASPLTISKAFEIASASSTAKTIEVSSNINDVAITQTGGNITLNLGGNTLTGDGSSEVITINGGSLTLKDNNGGGKITGGRRGVVVKGTFTMSSGEISNITSTYGGIGVWVEENGTFIMTGGKICNNTGTGSANGGGVLTRGTFTMSGGEISGNEAAGSGGGVAFQDGSFTMSGSAVIRNNTAANGGGVDVSVTNDDTFTMNGGTIEGNTATSDGGGVSVNATGCVFEMNGGTISNNTARNGSGVCTSGAFTMNGGAISHHVTGYGVSVDSRGTFNGNGTGIFEDNSPSDYRGTYSGTQTDNSDSWTH